MSFVHPSPDPQDRIPLAIGLTSRNGTLTVDGQIANGFVDPQQPPKVVKRPGLGDVADSPGTCGQGITVVDGALFAVSGSTLYKGLSSGSITTGNPPTHGQSVFFKGFFYLMGQNNHMYRSTLPGFQFTDLGVVVATTGDEAGVNVFNDQLLAIDGTNTTIYYSTDGTTFTNGTLGTISYERASVVLGNTFYMFDDGMGTYSKTTDIHTLGSWSTGSTSGISSTAGFLLAPHNGVLWCIPNSGTDAGKVFSSPDGITWTLETSSMVSSFSGNVGTQARGISVGGYLYVLAATSGVNSTLWASQDGVNWANVATLSSFKRLPFCLCNNNDTIAFSGGNSNGDICGFLGRSITINSFSSQGDVAIPCTETADMVQNLAGDKLMIKGTEAAYYYDTSSGALTQITDADYPAVTVPGIVYLDGTFYVMDPDGTIWASAEDDPSSWASTDFITAEFEPDAGVALSKYLAYVVAFGQWTTEMFWDAGNATGSPLSPVQNNVLMVGCASAASVAQVESTIIWMAQRKGQGSTFQKGRFVAMLQGQTYVKISTPDVDRILDNDDLELVYSTVVSVSGHQFYLLSLNTSAVTLAYDFGTKLWHTWSRNTANSPLTVSSLTQSSGVATAVTSTAHGLSDGDPVTILGANQSGYNMVLTPVNVVDTTTFTYLVASATVSPATGTITATTYTESIFDAVSASNLSNEQVIQDSTGNLYFLDPTLAWDGTLDFLPINFRIRTPNIDNGNNERKYCSSVAANCDLTPSASTAMLRYSDDDYQTYSTYRRFDLSQVRNNLQRFGNYRRRAWEWRYTGGYVHRIQSLEAEIDQGNS